MAENIVEVIPAELEIFEKPCNQTAISASYEQVSYPKAALDNSSVIEFVSSGTDNSYRDLSTIRLCLTVAMMKSDGSKLTYNDAATKDYGVINNVIHSLFTQCAVTLNDVLITPSSSNYHYKAYLETLLNYGSDAKNTHLTLRGFELDTAGKTNTSDDTNLGFKERRSWFQTATATPATDSPLENEIHLTSPLHVDFFRNGKFLLNGVELKIKLTRSNDEFYLWGPAGTPKVKLVIKQASLVIRHFNISPKFLLGHDAGLRTGNAKYFYRRAEIKPFTISANQQSHTLNNISNGVIPTFLLFTMVPNANFVGTVTTNPFHFVHNDLSYFALYVKDKLVHTTPLQPVFGGTGKQFARAYETLFSGTNIHHSDRGHMITPHMFANGYFMLTYLLSPDLTDDLQHKNPVDRGEVRIELRFKNSLTHSITCLVYLLYDTEIYITKDRSIIIP